MPHYHKILNNKIEKLTKKLARFGLPKAFSPVQLSKNRVQVREYLKSQKDIDSLMIVTSKYHSGRAKKIFVKAMKSMDREIRVISCPTQYDDFNAEGWWKDREDLKRGALEYLKLFHFYLREQFEL
jgi:uncharacterized SAM-binding protein YcdF (DUF218 family)